MPKKARRRAAVADFAPRTISEAVAFLLLGAMLPCVFFAVTGTPIALILWFAAYCFWLFSRASERRRT